MNIKLFLAVLLVALMPLSGFAQNNYTWGNWNSWGDQGNGTYINPVIPSDYSDIDCIRVGGLCHFSKQYASIGITQHTNIRKIEYRMNGKTIQGDTITQPYIWLKSVWGLDGKSVFSYSTDGENYISFGDEYQLAWGNYRGDRIGLFCFNNQAEQGHVDIDYLHYQME